MGWFLRSKAPKPEGESGDRMQVPDQMWTKCPSCSSILYSKDLRRNFGVCTKCGFHFRLGAKQRLSLLTDRHSFIEMDATLRPLDPLTFKAKKRYRDQVKDAERKTGIPDAIITGRARILNIAVGIGAFEMDYMGGSMGSVVGEKLTRMIEASIPEKRPVIIVSSSGGARMQEGILSLMQMAKVSAALGRLGQARLPYISVLCDPTTGGVAASFAMLGDVIIAEPNALIGFAGPRVIERTIKQKLPPGFQRAEFLLEHGMLDRIIHRSQLRDEVAMILKNFGFGG